MFCPICKSNETGYFVQKDDYIFHRCSKCKSVFLPSHPSQTQLDAYYSKQFSYHDGLINEIVIRKRSRAILRKIKQLAPFSKSLCDVGSGYGFFLDESQKSGFNVFGIEPSGQLVHHAHTKYSVKSFHGTLDEYIRPVHDQFEIVTCIHVIEHVSNPHKFVQDLLRLVKPGGILYIETPNSDSHLFYVEKEKYTFLIPPEHLWLFSFDSIQHLLPKHASVIYMDTYSYSEHLMGIVKRLICDCKPSLQTSESEKKRSQNKMRNDNTFRKNLSHSLFDRLLAPLFTGLLNLYHKGSILELYIRKKK